MSFDFSGDPDQELDPGSFFNDTGITMINYDYLYYLRQGLCLRTLVYLKNIILMLFFV